jgi:hypothetical protein
LLQYVVECNSSARDRYEAAEIHRTDQRRSSLAVAARAQQTDRKRRIGVLLLSNAEAVSLRREIREGLPKGGYAEWQNIDFEVRPAEGKLDLLPSLATELVAIKVDVIVAIFTPCALAAKQATADIPIVFQPGIFLVASTSLTPVASLRCRLPLVAQRRNRLYSAQFRQQLIRNKPNARQSRR